MTAVRGIGWLAAGRHGSVRLGFEGDREPGRDETFSHSFKNFGRLDHASRATCYAVALALKDAGMPYPLAARGDIGIVGTGATGCREADLNYFKDYIGGNRILGRGNLFIYTLPTSPLAEAAIHFGIAGPMFYVGAEKRRLSIAIDTAARIMKDQSLSTMIAGTVDGSEAVFVVLSNVGDDGTGADAEMVCSVDHATGALNEEMPILDMVERLKSVKTGGRMR